MSYSGRPVRPLPSLETFGHSALGGAALAAQGFDERLGDVLGSEVWDFAIGGSIGSWHDSGNSPTSQGDGGFNTVYHVRNMVEYGQTAPYLPGSSALAWYGIHDLAILGPGANLVPFEHALRAIIARLRVGAVFEDTHSSVVKAGTWGSLAGWIYNSGTAVAYTTDAAATVTITVPADFPGGTVVLGFNTNAQGEGAIANISVDNGPAITHDTRNINPVNYGSVRPTNAKTGASVKRLTGLSAGTHTIVISLTSLVGAFFFDWWGIEAVPAPLVIIPNAYRMSYSPIYNTWPYMPTDADVVGAGGLNERIKNVCNEFDEAVLFWDADAVLNKDFSRFLPDQNHMNDLGLSLLAEDLVNRVRSSGLLTDQRIIRSGSRRNFRPFIHLTREAQSIAANTLVAISWTQVRRAEPSEELWWSTLNPTRIYTRRSGLYRITFRAAFVGNSTGERLYLIRHNGATTIAQDRRGMSGAAGGADVAISVEEHFAPGDYITAEVYHTATTTPLNVLKDARKSPEITVTYLGLGD